MSGSLSKSIRKKVQDRAGGCCEYCLSQSRFSPDPFSIEHIIPRSGGGTNKKSNLAFACQGCNNRKYTHTEGIDPVTGEAVPLFHPRNDSWDQHFQWIAGATVIVGITPTGRATVEKLRLNREGVVNLRKVLVSADEHPPRLD